MIYEYRCPVCGSVKELMRSVADRDAPVRCAYSAGDYAPMVRVMSATPGKVKNPAAGDSK